MHQAFVTWVVLQFRKETRREATLCGSFAAFRAACVLDLVGHIHSLGQLRSGSSAADAVAFAVPHDLVIGVWILQKDTFHIITGERYVAIKTAHKKSN